MTYTPALDRLLSARYKAQHELELARYWCEAKLIADARAELARLDREIDAELTGVAA